MEKRSQQPPSSPSGSFPKEGIPRSNSFEEEIDRMFATGRLEEESRGDEAGGWPFGGRSATFAGSSGRTSLDPIGRYVYQEHNSFFRTRMPKATHWSVVWSDLMMTMFIFFVVLFVFFSLHSRTVNIQTLGGELRSGIGAGRIGEGGGAWPSDAGREVESPDRIFTVSRQAIVDDRLEDFASVDLAPDLSVRIVLTGDVLFDPGAADLKEASRRSLAKIADLLRRTPYMVNVVGHTDDAPIHTDRFPSNWELSTARAGAVARFLIERTGLPADRFYVTGRAANQPVLRNTSEANRATNRRVEIVITKNLPEQMLVREPEKLLVPQANADKAKNRVVRLPYRGLFTFSACP